jgi:hypothetical protein
VDVLQSTDGTLTLSGVLLQETFLCDVHWKHFFRLQFPHICARDFHFELFSVHSPLLRESYLVSFPPLNYMLKFSGLPCLSSGRLEKTAPSSHTLQLLLAIWEAPHPLEENNSMRNEIARRRSDNRNSKLLLQRSTTGLMLLVFLRYKDTEPNTLREQVPAVPYAFRGLMVHRFLQFALLIAICCVLHRIGNQDVHC